ncbi:hypothetical protein MTP03_12570 [Tsukamurella sp. PLM1]|nr:hypothetical protein MTP03_12570 [Tsukamurella sp. PLM1]
MHEDLRPQPPDQPAEGREAAVRPVVAVSHAECRGVREHHVDGPPVRAGRSLKARRRACACVHWFAPPRYRIDPPRPATVRPATVTTRPSALTPPRGPGGSHGRPPRTNPPLVRR